MVYIFYIIYITLLNIKEDKKIIDEVLLIRPLNTGKEATEELMHDEKNTDIIIEARIIRLVYMY